MSESRTREPSSSGSETSRSGRPYRKPQRFSPPPIHPSTSRTQQAANSKKAATPAPRKRQTDLMVDAKKYHARKKRKFFIS